MMTTSISTEAMAQQLEDVWQQDCPPLAPFSETGILKTVEEAYAVQTHWTRLRLGKGDKILGRKIGLTSRAIQEQLGVKEPDYGSLWNSRFFPSSKDRAVIPSRLFIQPRLEGEIAFKIGRKIQGPNITSQEVMEATQSLAVAVEIIDSRIENWRIKLIDTVADNASYGGFATGEWSESLLKSDLPSLKMTTVQNGNCVAEGMGSAVMGHPAVAAAWLANKLSTFGISLEPGDVILSGSLAKAIPARQGDEFVFQVKGQSPLTIVFE